MTIDDLEFVRAHCLVLVGETGNGKSSLINKLLAAILGGAPGDRWATVGDSVESQTQEPEAFDMRVNGANWCLIDTPGLMDSNGAHTDQVIF
eukprot:TRINITY_DN21451_c0_g1_i1.p2 TRINITY_DN21451_c0_g1~~TRINITY_DN21451_c0_g1_i1.p2  ORF type:complete len:105 (+),score=9.57 TRINITY_DN21451_c0_g1_i1:40-315(+)